MPEAVWIDGAFKLEAELWRADSDVGIVLAHPHPLFGGDMWYPLLGVIAKRAQERGISALRFNFRGVGRSEGRYSHGKGEMDDLSAAVEYMKDAGCKVVVPVGYSFGAWIVMKRVATGGDDRWVAIAPPVNFARHPKSSQLSGEGLIICGSKDMLSPASKVRREYERFRVVVVDGADHFFVDFEDRVAREVLDFVKPNGVEKDA